MKRGYIMSRSPPRLYEYILKGINALSKEIEFYGWEECQDFQYFSAKNLIACCIKSSSKFCKLYTIDTKDYVTISTGILVPISPHSDRLIQRQGNNLFVKSEKKQISVYFNINDRMRCKFMRISQKGDEIVDFTPVGNNRILLLTKEGIIVYQEFSFKKATHGEISRFTLELGQNEFCRTMNVCGKGRFVGVGTYEQFKNNRLLKKVYLIEVDDDDDDMELLDHVDYAKKPYSREDGSYLSIINMDFYFGDYPLLIVAQYAGDGLMFSYVMKGGKLRPYDTHMRLHNNVALRMVRIGSMLTSIDYNGNISRIKF